MIVNELKQDNKLLKREYYRALFPVMFSVLGATINAIIDSVFISQRLGEDALAAVNLSMPVYLVLCTLGSLVATGASVCSARAAGNDNMAEVQRYFSSACIVCLFLSVIVTVIGVLFCGQLSELLAGSGRLSEMVDSYCFITYICSGVYIFSYIPLCYLQLEGKNRAISVCVAVMVTADILLDILLIYVFDFGMYGASAASVISSLAALILGFILLLGKNSNYRIERIRPNLKMIVDIVLFGSPRALGNLFDAVKLLFLNALILSATDERGVAVWALLNTLSELSLMIVSGVPRAAAPMISVCDTSKENGSIRLLTALEVRAGLIMSLAYTIIITLLHCPIERLFDVSSDLLFPLICLGISIVISTFCSIWERHFNSVGFIAAANTAAGIRLCAMPLAASFLLSLTHIPLWLFLPLSSLASLLIIAAIAFLVSLGSRKKKHPLSTVLLLDDHLEKEHKVLDFSIPPAMNEVCSAAEKITDFCVENKMNAETTMMLGLAIEELLSVIMQKTIGIVSIDIRVFALDSKTGIRIRSAGKNYNPFDDRNSDDDFMMGVNMINKMSDTTIHTYIWGMNCITIIFPRQDEEKI